MTVIDHDPPGALEREIADVVRSRVPDIFAQRQKAEAAWVAFTTAWERRFGKPYPMARYMAP